ncbi:MAG: glycosyl hydrolase [bacterium]|nr:glycosyl hydrolase [bacterium]
MIESTPDLAPASLGDKLARFWSLSGKKILDIEENYDNTNGTPVFTVAGRYSTRGWTEWTEGFVYGSALLQFDATGDESFLELARSCVVQRMASHVSHIGVHDHGFNNLSTYGNLLRLMVEGRIPQDDWQADFYKLAIKVSAAVQASRWSDIPGGGYIYSFNGPHSLFVDTVRSCRILMAGHALGHTLMGEGDKPISLLGRAVQHIAATAKYSVYYGEGRDAYDVRGRTTHEAVFNRNDGAFRCPNSQQGFSGFTTWTRGLAWAMLGFPEELEFLETLSDAELEPYGGRAELEALWLKSAEATCDFYIENTPTCGIPYWDTGAPLIHKLGDYLDRPAEPQNDYEPVDSSAAAIGAQGLLRLGRYFERRGDPQKAARYTQAGLTVSNTLFDSPYLSEDDSHQGLILHSIYHRPNGWDHIPKGSRIPHGESSMWGDYHARELALYLQRMIEGRPELTFFGGVTS